jgi:hypothetical protein
MAILSESNRAALLAYKYKVCWTNILYLRVCLLVYSCVYVSAYYSNIFCCTLTLSLQGGDSSYIYAHFLSPLAQYCVDNFTPVWLAPNTITLSGLCLPLAMTVLSIVYNPTLGPEGPRWLALCSGIGLFIYQVSGLLIIQCVCEC